MKITMIRCRKGVPFISTGLEVGHGFSSIALDGCLVVSPIFQKIKRERLLDHTLLRMQIEISGYKKEISMEGMCNSLSLRTLQHLLHCRIAQDIYTCNASIVISMMKIRSRIILLSNWYLLLVTPTRKH